MATTSSKFADRLAALKKGETWAKAKESAANSGKINPDIPDGKYLVMIVKCELGESASSGRLQFAEEFVILDGDHTGASIRNYAGLDTDKQVGNVLKDFATLGYVCEDPEDLSDAAKDLVENKVTLSLTVKTNKGQDDREYQNVYINKRVEEPGD